MFLTAAHSMAHELGRAPLGVRCALAVLLLVLTSLLTPASAQAGVILCDQHSIHTLADSGGAAARSPVSKPSNDELLYSLHELPKLPAGQTGGAGAPGAAGGGGVSAPAACGAACLAPEPTLVAWLGHGQYIFLPPLLPSGLFRPPRA
jgi:hypothetical protein